MKIKTKDLVTAALLTSLSMLIPNVFPTLPLGPFTATFASHVPVFVAMFISPLVAIAAGIGSMIGFLIKGLPVYVVARASMHIIAALIGAVMIKKGKNVWVVGLVTLVIHSILETISVIPFLNMVPPTKSGFTWYQLILIGTSIHHVIDFIITYVLILGLKRAKVVK